MQNCKLSLWLDEVLDGSCNQGHDVSHVKGFFLISLKCGTYFLAECIWLESQLCLQTGFQPVTNICNSLGVVYTGQGYLIHIG